MQLSTSWIQRDLRYSITKRSYGGNLALGKTVDLFLLLLLEYSFLKALLCGKERKVQPRGWKVVVDAGICSKCEISFFYKMFYCFFQVK